MLKIEHTSKGCNLSGQKVVSCNPTAKQN